MSHHKRSAAAQFFLEEDLDEDELDSNYSAGHNLMRGRSSNRTSLTNTRLNSSSSANVSSTGVSPGGGGRGSRHDSVFEPNDYQDENEVQELLNKATVTACEKTKLDNLKRVKEIIINRQSALLDNFLDEMLNFQTDSNADIRKYILEFIEEACETDPETIPKVLHNMILMLQDNRVSVQKKAIQVTAKIYRFTLMWLCKSKSVTEDMENAWSTVNDLKKLILKQIDSDSDGIRTHTVKFIETVILLQTPSESDSLKRKNDFCLDHVPITVKVARPRKLEEDARNLFEELLKFHGSRHATSVNLMTCMGSIVLISKLRPHFMGKVVTAMEKLNAILPPTLERSQVTSVRKHMKVQLIGLLRHSKGVDYYDSITTLLTDLGATHQELYKAVPNFDEIRAEKRKRQRANAEKEESSNRKRARLMIEEHEPVPVEEEEEDEEDYDDDEDMEKPEEQSKSEPSMLNKTEKIIFDQLTPEKAAEIVLVSMENLPDTLPAHFMASYTPIAIAGTENQIRHVSRLLAAQITAFQLGPAAALQGFQDKADVELSEPTQIPTLVSMPLGVTIPAPDAKSILMPMVSTKKKIAKSLKLSEITKPLSFEERQRHTTSAVMRILQSGEKLNDIKCRLIASIAVTSGFQLRFYIMQYIKLDIKSRLELGLSWIFAEYCLCQDFMTKAIPVKEESSIDRYEWTFFNLMKAVLETANETDKSALAWRLYTEPPTIPDKGLELLKTLCGQHIHATKGMQLLMELVTKRPKKLHYLYAILEFCSHSAEEVRTSGVNCVLKLYDSAENMRSVIEDYAVGTYLNSLRLPKPLELLFTEELGRKENQNEWTDDLVKSCLHLYLQLLTVKNSLIHELAKVYVETSADVKRSILRYIESPVRKMGMDSPDLMKLLDTFPKGAETLITRIIHILTDKTLPSADLVSRVRNLYAKRVSDVRFLIPVLNGLSKSEILSALPKLIKLNPNVVKEVFNRLLGIHADAETQHVSPISPVELMIALHNIEQSKCDVKTVIKATSLCFNETEVYTAEILAVVISQLLEHTPLPTLLMRTVIQTLALHSKLSGFIMNILVRLINKQVWTQPKVWEGFIKCCQRTLPKSIPILLTLPAPQLKQTLEEAPDLREPLAVHLMSFSQQQRSCLSPVILNIVLGENKEDVMVKEEDYYGDYQGEITTLEERSSGAIRSVKDEPRSPGGDELSIEIKDEPVEFMNE